jgi:aminopeptidase-like protein
MSTDTQPPPTITALRSGLDAKALGSELHERIQRLYPICRSITGKGIRETLALIGSEIDIKTHEVPTGTQVFDWTVPKEWNIRDAYIKDHLGARIVDFRSSNLHVVNYSVPVSGRFTFAQLRPHLFSIPERPDWIPYKTSYYRETWGFCLSDRQLQSLDQDGEYEVCIDAALQDGHLTLAECVLPGVDGDEILFSSHVCHPSLCNDNLSGVSVAVTLAKLLAQVSRRYTYRFLFVPGTIGPIAWLAQNESHAGRIKHGLVLACAGDRGQSTYKRSRRGDADIDRVMKLVLAASGEGYEIRDFSPYGYDERQYCSPGFNLPVGVLSRTPHGCFPEYHTSADNLDLVDPAALADSLNKCLGAVEILEANRTYTNLAPKCEPQLGKRGLYSSMGGHGHASFMEAAILWVLNQSDGTRTLLDIAERSQVPFAALSAAADALARADLIRVI